MFSLRTGRVKVNRSKMALSTLGRVAFRSAALSRALRPCLLARQAPTVNAVVPMASSAKDQMQEFWDKNQKLNRPIAPWINYKWEFPMLTSLTHRVTGIVMGVGLYGISISYLLSGGDWQALLNTLASMELGPSFWAPFKALMAFPLMYHCLNGFRHMWFDFKGGYEVTAQYKSGYVVYAASIALCLLVTGVAYM